MQEEYVDRHQPHVRQPAGKRPFLLLLSPDTLQLATASDATDGPPVASTVATMLTFKAERQPAARASMKPLALLHKLSSPARERGGGAEGHSGGGAAAGTAGSAARQQDPAAADSRLLLEDGEPLEEGQLLNFSIALSQVISEPDLMVDGPRSVRRLLAAAAAVVCQSHRCGAGCFANL